MGGVEVPTDIALDVGPSAFNLNQVLVANSLYMLPFKGNKFIEGWQISGLLTAESGYPFTVNTGITQAWTPNNKPMRPNYIGGCNWRVGNVHEWYNPACFAAPPVGYIGNLGRNNLVGPGLINQDFAIMKDTRIPKISEQFDVQFRAEIFNIFNHANFSLPSSASNFTGGGLSPVNISPSAGLITSTATTSRQIQFGLKIMF